MKNLDETPEIEVYCNRIHHEIKHGISHEKEDSTSIYIYIFNMFCWFPGLHQFRVRNVSVGQTY